MQLQVVKSCGKLVIVFDYQKCSEDEIDQIVLDVISGAGFCYDDLSIEDLPYIESSYIGYLVTEGKDFLKRFKK